MSTEDEEIAAAARSAGCEVPFSRPASLSTDTASIYDVLEHAAGALAQRYELIVLLQASSPLRLALDIDESLKLLMTSESESVISVTPALKPPQWMYKTDSRKRLAPVSADPEVSRRQEAPQVYVVNGAVYASATDWVLRRKSFVGEKSVGYVMPAERSVDIDTAADLALAEHFLQVSTRNSAR